MGCILDACDEMCKSCKEKTNLCGPGRCPVADRVIERLEQKILVEEPAVRALVARLAEKDARIAVLEKLLKETPVGDLDLATSMLVEKQHTMEYVAKLEGALSRIGDHADRAVMNGTAAMMRETLESIQEWTIRALHGKEVANHD